MIKLDNISFSFADKQIISDLSAEFEENNIYCIMGSSGIGKTTLLKIISGLLKAPSGSITGLENKKKSYVFQENRLIPWLSVYDNLTYVTDDREAIKDALTKTGLYDDRNKLPSELSGGMARRAAIARAASFSGDVFFIDEPLYGLDIKTSTEMLSLIKNIVGRKTAFVITHSPEEAFFLADKIVFITTSPISHLIIKQKNDFSSHESIKNFIL